jgi:iron(III) transport system permease protein
MLKISTIIRRTGWDWRTAALVGTVGLFLVLFMVVPLANVVKLAAWTSDGPTLHYISNALRSSAVRDSLTNALVIALIVTVAASLVALPLAFANVRLNFAGKGVLSALLLVPMILPPFVGAIGMRQLLGPEGVLNAALAGLGLAHGGRGPDWFIEHQFAGVVLLQTLHLYPIMYLNLVAALANVDPSLEEAGRNVGASGWTLLRRITFPLMLPGFFAGAILVFIWSLTDLGTPLMFGYRDVISVRIFDSISESGAPDPNALVVILLVIVGVIYYAAKLILGRGGHEMMARSVQVPAGRQAGWGKTAGCWLLFGSVILLAGLPHVMVILTSFSDRWSGTILPQVFSTAHFKEALEHPLTLGSIRNSLFYSLAATGVCVVLAVWLAQALVRKKFWGRGLLDAAAMLPLAIPGLVLAFGFLNCYHGIGAWLVEHGWWDQNYLYPESNPVVLLVAAYAVRRLPYMVRSAAAGFEQTSRTLEEAALNVGASPLRTLVKITGPLVLANLIAGAILVFTFSMLEVSDSLVLAKTEPFYPLTKAIWQVFNDEFQSFQYAMSSALGVLAMVLLGVSLLVSMRLLGRKMGTLFRA